MDEFNQVQGADYFKRTWLRKFFKKCVFREDYDHENKGLVKDIREIGGDYLVDDDSKKIKFVPAIHLIQLR